MSPLLELENISKSFGATKALRAVSASFTSGKLHAIVGENGAGKSTLIKTIMGIHQPDSGEIRLSGKRVVVANPVVSRSFGFAAVYQEPLVYPYLDVLENLFMSRPLTNAYGNLDRKAMAKVAAPILEQVGLNDSILRKEMGTLRLGHQQLLMIAKALIEDAKLIIFDEPTSILSGTETEHLFAIIDGLKESGKAIVYISHRLEELSRIADEVTILLDGQTIGHRTKAEMNTDEIVSMMAGKEIRDYQVVANLHPPVKEGPPALELKDLTKHGEFNRVCLQVWPGEILGLYGQVGAGRSEVALSIFGGSIPDSGQILLDNRPVTIRNPREAIRMGIGYLPEDRKVQGVFSFQSIANNLTSVVLDKVSGLLGYVSKTKTRDLVESYRERLKIKYAHQADPISSLSGGNQQKVVLGRWMAEDLKLLILDEPTQGIDIMTKRDIHRLIQSLAADGLAVIVISSDLPEILAVSTRILVMNRGRVVGEHDKNLDCDMPELLLSEAIGLQEVGQLE